MVGRVNKKEITYRTIDELKHPDYNPRQIKKEQFEQLKQSLRRFEAVEPVVINKAQGRENIIVGGNQRIRAAGALGWKEFPCVYVDLPLELEKELNVRLNANTGEWDFDILANEFDVELLNEWGLESLPFDADTFEPVGEDEQGKLDEKQLTKCPKCGEVFDHAENKA